MARSNSVGKLREIVESNQDPKEALLASLGNLDDVEVFHSQVLVCTHTGSKYHPGTTILRTDKDLLEQQFQCSVGLVVKLGPGAFVDDAVAKFHGTKLKVGDWILFRPSDGLQLYVKQVPCRLFEDVNIKMRVADPTLYW